MNDTAQHIITIEIQKRLADRKMAVMMKEQSEKAVRQHNSRIDTLDKEIASLEEVLNEG